MYILSMAKSKYELRDLTGEAVIITGATSGIGKAAAYALVEAGCKVVLNARTEAKLKDLVNDLGIENAIYVAGDCSSPDLNRKLVAAALAKFGKINAVIPNAGIGMYGSILDYSDDQISQMLRTNIDSTIHLIRAAVPAMIKTGFGDIVIVASVAGFHSAANQAVYSGTKHAQVGIAAALDRELREKGIRVALVCPAGVATEFAMGTGRTAGMEKLATYLKPEDVAHQIAHILQQPKSIRTFIWTLWSMNQQS
jgi:NADP-dependent 3-hydroxy acid dehydrogenase YdfG